MTDVLRDRALLYHDTSLWPAPPAPRQQWAPPAPPKKRRRWPWITGGVVVLIIAISAAGGSSRKTTTTSAVGIAAPAPPAVTNAPPAAPSVTAATQQPTTPALVTVFSDTGSGIHTTEKFEIPTGDWDLQWHYDCAGSYLGEGNFQVYVNGGDGSALGVNQLGKGGSDTEHFHSGAGVYYLEVNSECNWSVKVVTAP